MGALETSQFRNHPSSISACWIGRKWIPSAWRHLKLPFLDLNKVEFWGCQEAENDLKVPFEDLNHRFYDLIEVAFWAVHKQKMSSHRILTTRKVAFLIIPRRILGWSRGRKNVKSLMSPWASSFLPQPFRILRWSRDRKWVQSDIGAYETSLSRLHPSGPWPTQIAIWLKSKKRWMKMWNCNLKSFYASSLTENSNFFNSIKRRFNWSNGTKKVIFCLLMYPKFFFDDVKMARFKWTPGRGNSFSSS